MFWDRNELMPILCKPNLPDGENLRRIHWEYPLGCLQPKPGELRNFIGGIFSLSAINAVANLESAATLSTIRDRMDEGITRLDASIGGINESADAIRKSVDNVGAGVQRIGDSVDALRTSIAQEFGVIGKRLDALREAQDRTTLAIEQQTEALTASIDALTEAVSQSSLVLREVLDTLRHPYRAKAAELRDEADRWLLKAMASSGATREGNLQDAFDLFQNCSENPIGKQDASVWFNLGWIRWDRQQDLKAAYAAFDRAQRLAEGENRFFFGRSALFKSYLLNAEGKPEEAYACLGDVASQLNDPTLLFDVARYACNSGKKESAREFLSRAIDLQPTLSVIMFAEPDFRPFIR